MVILCLPFLLRRRNVMGFGFGVQFRLQGWNLAITALGLGFRVSGLGFRVLLGPGEFDSETVEFSRVKRG